MRGRIMVVLRFHKPPVMVRFHPAQPLFGNLVQRIERDYSGLAPYPSSGSTPEVSINLNVPFLAGGMVDAGGSYEPPA